MGVWCSLIDVRGRCVCADDGCVAEEVIMNSAERGYVEDVLTPLVRKFHSSPSRLTTHLVIIVWTMVVEASGSRVE